MSTNSLNYELVLYFIEVNFREFVAVNLILLLARLEVLPLTGIK